MKSFNLKNLVFLLLSFAIFSSCNQTEASMETSENTTSAKKVNLKKDAEPYHISPNATANKKLVVEYIEACIAVDADKIRNSVGPGYMDYGPGMLDSANIEQVIEGWARQKKVSSNRKHGIMAVTALESTEPGPAQGDWVHVWGVYTATGNDDRKMEISIPYHSATRIENGKIVWSRSFFDNLETALKLGSVKAVEQ